MSKTRDLESAQAKAATLHEALPYLARFHGATVVVKYGGHAMTDPALAASFAADIVFLRYAGLRPVVVHGGGPQINAQLDTLGIEAKFAGGLRVTTAETMNVVRMVLVGQVQRDVVGLLNAHGPFGVGLSGEDGQLFTAVRRPAIVGGKPIDIGFVGDICAVEPGVVTSLLDDGRIPVVSSVARGFDDEGNPCIYNVNADTAAAALAVALNAEKFVVLTDVEGLYADWSGGSSGSTSSASEVISALSADELETLLPTLSAGMVPKMEACLRAVRGGVRSVHVLDGRVPHAVLLEIFTDEGIGTMVRAEP
jgi:acetylglutamate kinase